MGSVNHLNKFMDGAKEFTSKFSESMSKSNKKKFHWTEVQDKAFFALVDKIAQITANYHYCADRKTRLKCDASKEG